MNKHILLISLLLSANAFAATHGMEKPMDKTPQASTVIHQGKGNVVSIDPAKSIIKLRHDPIPSLGWPTMTMNFKVADPALLQGIKPGSTVAFDLGEGNKPGSWVITRITPKNE